MEMATNRNKDSQSSEPWVGKSTLDKTVAEVKNINPEDIKNAAAEFTTRVRDFTIDTYNGSLTYVRSNPVRTAVGLAALGFIAGVITARRRAA